MLFRLVRPPFPNSHQVDLERDFRPTDILSGENAWIHTRLVGRPIDYRLLNQLRNLKAWYENNVQYAMRRFKIHEAELVSGVAVQNKQRKRSRELNHLRVRGDEYLTPGTAQGDVRAPD